MPKVTMSSFIVSLLAHKLDARGLRTHDTSLWGVATKLYKAGIEDLEDLAGVQMNSLTSEWSRRDMKAIQERE